ncbi:MAG: HEAT repeat domain-containing protein [Planctomycetota bacterium]
MTRSKFTSGAWCAIVASLALASGCRALRPEAELLKEIRESTIIPKLGSYDENEQQWAYQKLRTALDKAPAETIEILAASLRDPITDDRTKLVVACLLGRVPDERALPVLVKNIGVANDSTRAIVRDALEPFGVRVVSSMEEVLETGDESARGAAAEVLHDLRRPEGFDAMWRRLSDETDPAIRYVLVLGIAADDRTLALERLIQASRDSDLLVREICWQALTYRTQPPDHITFDHTAEPPQREAQLVTFRRWLEVQLAAQR